MTETQSKQQPDPQACSHYFRDEIKLIDYLRVLWKWKWLILVGTLVCVVVAAVISLQMPRIYTVSMIITPGSSGWNDETGKPRPLDSLDNINGRINGGIYSRKIKDAPGMDRLHSRIHFTSSTLRGTDMIRVTSRWDERDADLGMKASQEFLRLIAHDYEKIVDLRTNYYNTQVFIEQGKIDMIETKKKDIDQQILLNVSTVEQIRDEMKQHQKSREHIWQRKDALMQEIRLIRDQMEKIEQRRSAFLQGKDAEEDITLLLFSTMIQEHASYFNSLNNQIHELSTRHDGLRLQIDELSKKIDATKIEIQRLNLAKEELDTSVKSLEVSIAKLIFEKGMVSNIEVVINPERSPHPIKPNTKQNTLLAGVVALFIFIFLAFFIEYLKNVLRTE